MAVKFYGVLLALVIVDLILTKFLDGGVYGIIDLLLDSLAEFLCSVILGHVYHDAFNGNSLDFPVREHTPDLCQFLLFGRNALF